MLPTIILVSVIAIGVGGGYYYTVQASKRDGVQWKVNPLQITFSADDGSGSAKDSLTCRPSIGPITLQAKSSEPDRVLLSVSVTSFDGCGNAPDKLDVSAACAGQGNQNGDSGDDENCEGTFTGQVDVIGPSGYENIGGTLDVQIIVTED